MRNRHLSQFHRFLVVTAVAFVLLILVFVAYVFSEKRIDRANDLRSLSLQLAGELRQSSDDLTRMVRTYVETGDQIYKKHYQEILDIRDGRKPRPVDSYNVYWDLVLADDKRPRSFGDANPLLDLMRSAQFTAEELAALDEAKANSDWLTQREYAAIQLIESDPGQRDKARTMLHDETYHKAKARIMAPIAKVIELSDQRTLQAVRNAEQFAVLMRWGFVLAGIVVLFTLYRAYRALHQILGSSLDTLHQHFARLGAGDLSSPISVSEQNRDSILGWMDEMRTQLNEANARRQTSELRFRDMVNTTDGIVWEADAQTFNFTFISAKAEQLLGFPEADWYQPGFWVEHLHPEDKNWAPEYCAACTGRLEPHDFEYRFIARDGRTVWLHDIVTVVKENNAPRWLRGIMIDITARKRVEHALRQSEAELNLYRQDLEALVAERTRELDEKNKALKNTLTQLQQAQDHLIQESKLASLGGLVAGIAHELNTPIGNARTVATTLIDQSETFLHRMEGDHPIKKTEFLSFLEHLSEGTRILDHNMIRASDLIHSFKQVAVDRTSSQRRKFNMREVAEEAILTMRPMTKKLPFVIRVDVAPDIEIDSYPGAFGQVLINLIENAINHGLAGRATGQIEVAGRQVGQMAELSVADDGCGISKENLSKVFDPFFTTRLGQGGSGLGLNIVFNIVNGLLGGKVSVTSTPESGARFTVLLALKAPAPSAE